MFRPQAFLVVCLGFIMATTPAAEAAARRGRATRTRARVSRPKAPALPSLIQPVAASTRDLEIGEACRRGLGYTPGAVVAMDPATGRVISIVNPGHALARAYQPCSVFKIVVAISGLTEGDHDLEDRARLEIGRAHV